MIALGCLYEKVKEARDRVATLRLMASPKASVCHESMRDKK